MHRDLSALVTLRPLCPNFCIFSCSPRSHGSFVLAVQESESQTSGPKETKSKSMPKANYELKESSEILIAFQVSSMTENRDSSPYFDLQVAMIRSFGVERVERKVFESQRETETSRPTSSLCKREDEENRTGASLKKPHQSSK